MKRRALIVGVTGQDGSYLAELLLAKDYEVHGTIRRASTFNTGRVEHLYVDAHEDTDGLRLHHADLSDGTSLRRVVEAVRPHEVYNLGAQSHVRVSFDIPEYTADVVGMGALRLLEVVRDHIDRTGEPVRVYQAGSSEMFGSSPGPQSEDTPFRPRSPYAIGKVAAHHFAVNYREAYGMFVANGILFNHESPRRGETFVTRKTTIAVGRILAGLQPKLYLGNLAATRDWGFAGDYAEAMWRILQAPKPGDYVVGTGEMHSVEDFVADAFRLVGLDWHRHVEIDRRYFRPTEVDSLQADARKIERELGWRPEILYPQLVEAMVTADVRAAARERQMQRAA